MKTTDKQWFVDLTAQETVTLNGGRRGADDGPNHDVGDDHGRRGGRGGRRNDDGHYHR
jgi:hypothetical protein